MYAIRSYYDEVAEWGLTDEEAKHEKELTQKYDELEKRPKSLMKLFSKQSSSPLMHRLKLKGPVSTDEVLQSSHKKSEILPK